jgi:hypothetical protein
MCSVGISVALLASASNYSTRGLSVIAELSRTISVSVQRRAFASADPVHRDLLANATAQVYAVLPTAVTEPLG